MIVLIIILSLLFLILIWLLVIPIQIIVNSDGPFLKVNIVSIGSAGVYLVENIPVLRIDVPFVKKDIPFTSFRGKSKKEKPVKTEKDKPKKSKKKSFSKKRLKWILRLFRIPGSFVLKRANVNIDTGDVITNAYMFPLFGYLDGHRKNWSWSVNYFGEIEIYLILQSSVLRMIYVYLK